MSYQKELNSILSNLVCDYAEYNSDSYYLSLNDLPSDEQGKLAAAYLETIDRDIADCVYGNDLSENSNYVCALLKMLKDPSKENKDNFSTIVNNNILVYFKEELQGLINEACNDYYFERMNERRKCA